NMGQASPQPMVMTTSEALTASTVRTFGVAAVMSMPSSAMASTATGLSWSAGADQADRTSMRPWQSSLTQPAAIWERPALWTQTNSTEGWWSTAGLWVSVVITSAFGRGEFGQQGANVRVDVIAHDPHPVNAFDAALGGLIGDPGVNGAGHVLDRFDFGFLAEHDHPIDPG